MDARALTIALGGRWCSRYGLASCPAHDDRSPSLKIKDDPRKSDGIDLHCFAGCRWQDVKAELRQRGLVETNGQWKAPPPPKPRPGSLAKFPIFHGIESLTIFADADPTGLEAAQVCVDRWLFAGREARNSYLKEIL
jgi:putative DNA primase/helicase